MGLYKAEVEIEDNRRTDCTCHIIKAKSEKDVILTIVKLHYKELFVEDFGKMVCGKSISVEINKVKIDQSKRCEK